MSGVSVVVISKNEGFLTSTLEALKMQCAEIGAECVVVDASRGSLSHLRDAHPWVRWHDSTAPRDREVTIPHQRNEGVGIAAGHVIAFCDAGGIPAEGWLSRLTAPIVDGLLSATGGPIRSVRPSAYGTLNEVPSGSKVPSVVTSNFAVSRELFDRVGGFDERFDYGSDTDFGWRVEEAGEKAVSVCDAVMTIDWGDRRRQLRRDWRYGQAKARQWQLRPERRMTLVQDSPEVLVYPLLLLTAPPAILAAMATRRWVLLAPWIQALSILHRRDRSFGRPRDAMLSHLVVSLGICHEMLSTSPSRVAAGRRHMLGGRVPVEQ